MVHILNWMKLATEHRLPKSSWFLRRLISQKCRILNSPFCLVFDYKRPTSIATAAGAVVNLYCLRATSVLQPHAHEKALVVSTCCTSTRGTDTKEKRILNSTEHLELVRLLDDHLQAAVLPQDGLPHFSYPAGLLLLGAQLPFRTVLQEGGRSGIKWGKQSAEPKYVYVLL